MGFEVLFEQCFLPDPPDWGAWVETVFGKV